jgi:hypothetical protein
MYVYIYTYRIHGSFNDYGASNGRTIINWNGRKITGCGPISGAARAFVWMNWGRKRITSTKTVGVRPWFDRAPPVNKSEALQLDPTSSVSLCVCTHTYISPCQLESVDCYKLNLGPAELFPILGYFSPCIFISNKLGRVIWMSYLYAHRLKVSILEHQIKISYNPPTYFDDRGSPPDETQNSLLMEYM